MNLFVANLNFKIDNDQLKELFDEFGQVNSARIIFDRETGRSRGFGFVEMESEEEGEKAIEALNGEEVDGRELVVKKARPRSEQM